jgi:hypothetical protein
VASTTPDASTSGGTDTSSMADKRDSVLEEHEVVPAPGSASAGEQSDALAVPF